jgi:probable LLM family oxidoreductase
MEIGIYSFVENTPDPDTGRVLPAAERMRRLLEEIELADQVGLDVFGIGEHHRPDYVASAPSVVLAAAAARTSRIRLTTSVSVLSSDDPVRVFQQHATVDLISNGRAELMAGRGSFIESFPLFGYDLRQYESLFSEKLELLLQIRDRERVTWRGRHRAPLSDQPVYPRPVQDPMPIWVAVGGTPESVVRAATLGLPMAIAIIGGGWAQFEPFAELYREAWAKAGHDPAKARLSLNLHGFVADTTAEADALYWPRQLDVMGRIGRERGWGPPSRQRYEAETTLPGAIVLGDWERVAEKLIAQHRLFRHDRVLLQLSLGTMPHDKLLRAIDLLGTKVAPLVRRETALASV